jgi:hypothetical protein
MNNIVLVWRLFGAILGIFFSVFFNLVYVTLCPYAWDTDSAKVDHYNYINHFESLL